MKVFIKPNEQQKIENDLPEILKQRENQLSRVNLNVIDDCVYILDAEDPSRFKKLNL